MGNGLVMLRLVRADEGKSNNIATILEVIFLMLMSVVCQHTLPAWYLQRFVKTSRFIRVVLIEVIAHVQALLIMMIA